MEHYQGQTPQPYMAGGLPPVRKKKSKLWIWILLGAVALCVCGAICFSFLLRHLFVKVRSGEDVALLLAEQAEELGYENALSELSATYAVRVGEHTYYRLQQNYRGLPVVGRSIVYVTDSWGRHVGNSHNLRDIPAELELKPAVQPIDMVPGIIQHLQWSYPESYRDSYSIPQDMQLCIYDLDGQAHLAYTFRMEGLIWVMDAIDGTVLNTRKILMDIGSENPLGVVSDVLNVRGREYAKKAEEKEIYLYSAATQTYYDPVQRQFQAQRLWPVDMADNTLGNILITQNRYDNGAAALDVVYGFADVFQKKLDTTEGGPIILVFDDFLEGQTVCWAAAGLGTPSEFLSYQVSEEMKERAYAQIGLITLGSEMMLDPLQSADIIGHEYMHVLADKRVGWYGNDRQTWALNEGISDLMGQLLTAILFPEAELDWQFVARPIADPQTASYPVHVGQYGDFLNYRVLSPDGGTLDAAGMPLTADYAHFYSTVISHAGYRMWKGVDGEALDSAQLAQLWYRTVLMLPSNANFSDFRRILTMNAQWMGLTAGQRQCVEAALQYAQIPDHQVQGQVFEVGEDCQVQVLDGNGELVDGYRIAVTRMTAAQTLQLEEPKEIIRKGTVRKPCRLQLENGLYTVALTLPGVEHAPIRFCFRVRAGGAQEILIPTSFRAAIGGDPQLILPQTQPSEGVQQAGEIPHIMNKKEYAYTDPAEGWHKRYYLTYPEFQGTDAVCGIITADILSAVNAQISHWENNDLLYLESPRLDSNGNPVSFEEGYEIQVSHNADGLLCLLLKHNGITYNSVFYSLRTGTPLWNHILAGKDTERFLGDVKRYVWWYATEAKALPLTDGHKNALDSMKLENFRFAVVEEELVVLDMFDQEMIPTGLRYSYDYLDRLENGLKIFEKADGVSAEQVKWDRNYDVPMQDPRAKERYTTYECSYMQLQGESEAIAAINKSLYNIAAAFMYDKSDEQIRAEWFDYGTHRGFWMNGNMDQSYNANGIFSVQMHYYGHLGSMRETKEERDFEGYYGMTFDTKTGRMLTLSDLTGIPEEVLRVLLRERRFGPATFASLRSSVWQMPGSEDAWNQWLENCNLDDCPVSVAEDGQILIYVSQQELMGLPDGGRTTYTVFQTGLFIGTGNG